MINNNKLNILLLIQIIDEIYPQRYAEAELFQVQKRHSRIKVIQYVKF